MHRFYLSLQKQNRLNETLLQAFGSLRTSDFAGCKVQLAGDDVSTKSLVSALITLLGYVPDDKYFIFVLLFQHAHSPIGVACIMSITRNRHNTIPTWKKFCCILTNQVCVYKMIMFNLFMLHLVVPVLPQDDSNQAERLKALQVLLPLIVEEMLCQQSICRHKEPSMNITESTSEAILTFPANGLTTTIGDSISLSLATWYT
jgi:hypothetical protein